MKTYGEVEADIQILDLVAKWSFGIVKPRSPYPPSARWRGRPQSRSGSCGDEDEPLHLPETQPSAPSLYTLSYQDSFSLSYLSYILFFLPFCLSASAVTR
jgi:hypothetical protein